METKELIVSETSTKEISNSTSNVQQTVNNVVNPDSKPNNSIESPSKIILSQNILSNPRVLRMDKDISNCQYYISELKKLIDNLTSEISGNNQNVYDISIFMCICRNARDYW